MRRRTSGLNFNRRKKKINIGLLKEITTWAVEIGAAMLAAVVVVLFFGFQISVVGPSMSPTLENGEKILVNRFVYKLFSPKQNDVIVFLPNGNGRSHYYIKRVIAVPGDRVQVRDGVIYVNGKAFEEKTETDTAIENALLAEDEIVIGEDEYFVMGDNRNNSEDSRYASIGNVKKEYIVGKAWCIVYPWSRFGLLK